MGRVEEVQWMKVWRKVVASRGVVGAEVRIWVGG